MASLTSLPVELVALIGELTDPHSHFDLICTCRYIAGALRDIAARHRAAAARSSCSDLEPQTLPQLLRRVVKDPIAAHHVRSIQIWGVRSTWADWRPFQLEYIEGSHDIFQQERALKWTFAPGEIDEYLDLASQFHPLLVEGDSGRELARGQLASGDDGPLKALLIALSPRLNSLYFAQGGIFKEEEDFEGVAPSSLDWCAKFIICHREESIVDWPCGLESLRHLAIGVETGTWLDQSGIDRYEPEFLAELLNLPNLESLYLRGLSQEDADGSETYPISPGCSTLRHLFLDNIDQVDTETWGHMMQACNTQLTSLAFRGGAQDNIDDFLRLARDHCINLQSVMFYGVRGSDLSGYRCSLYLPEDLGGYSSAPALRHLTLCAGDLALGVGHWNDEQTRPGPRERLMEYVLRDLPLPSTLEVLVFIEGFHSVEVFLTGHAPSSSLSDAADWFDDMLAALISARVDDGGSEEDDDNETHEEDESDSCHQDSQALERSTDDDTEPHQQISQQHEVKEDGDDDGEQSTKPPYLYPDLKIIYIDPWPPLPPRSRPAISTSKLWLQKSIQAAHERGIEVRTKVNINSYRQDIDLHIPPDRYDMRPDLTPAENEFFDPILGQWVGRGCESCGVCSSCHELFSEEAWAGAYKAPPDNETDGVNDDLTHTAEDQIAQEICTRGIDKSGEDHWIQDYYVQPLDAFRRDRLCEGRKVQDQPVGALPSLGFPVTRRKLLAQNVA